MIYVKTELGRTALHDRSLGLLPRQRSVFILFDGKRSADDALKATAALGVKPDDLAHLVALGLLAPLEGGNAEPVKAAATPHMSIAPSSQLHTELGLDDTPPPLLSDQAHYSKAYLVAVKLTGALGLRGFRLNLAVEATTGYDGLVAMLPKIKDAVGQTACQPLEHMLNG